MTWKKAKKHIKDDPRYKAFSDDDHVRVDALVAVDAFLLSNSKNVKRSMIDFNETRWCKLRMNSRLF